MFPSGLRTGDEVLAVNGATVSGLDLDPELIQNLFSQQKLQLLLQRDHLSGPEAPAIAAAAWPCPSQPVAPPGLQAWTCHSGA